MSTRNEGRTMWKRNTLVLAILSSGLAVSVLPRLVAQETLEQAPLLECMEGLKDNLKNLAGSVQDAAQNDASLERIAAMQALTLRAKRLSPPNLEDFAVEERDNHLRAFRADLARLLIEMANMEIDLLEGRNADAFQRIIKPLYEMREAAHGRFQKD